MLLSCITKAGRVWLVAILFVTMPSLQADESLAQKSQKAQLASQAIEQSQLEKAKSAAAETRQREAKVLEKQQLDGWQQQQQHKAQSHFDARRQRELKYLQDAKSAAKLKRKIAKE